jgi:hypothetical protein
MAPATLQWGLLFSGMLLFTACVQKQPGNQSSNTATDTNATAVTAVPDLGPPPAVPDTQFIVVDSVVNIRMNNGAVPKRPGAFDSTLADYWLQCYTRAQKLPAFLRFKYQGTVMMGARGNLMDAVVHVQDSVKDHIAKEKYQQDFHRLDPSQQRELERTYPVLFQKQL